MSKPSPYPSPKGRGNSNVENPPLPVGEGTGVRGGIRLLRTFAIYAVLSLLLYWALRSVLLIDIWETIKQLRLRQIIILLLINAVVIALMAARWWIIVRADNHSVPILPLAGYRLSAFGVSYFTPGAQAGGEPLQIIYLQKRCGLTCARATATVIMDKLLGVPDQFPAAGCGRVGCV